jgi:hypothetical protein
MTKLAPASVTLDDLARLVSLESRGTTKRGVDATDPRPQLFAAILAE